MEVNTEMTEEEFIQETGIFCNSGIRHLPYREKNLSEYIEDVEKNNVLFQIHEGVVEYFEKQEINIPDDFCVNIALVCRTHDTNEPMYSISIINDGGVRFNTLVSYDLKDDNIIELLINSLCKAMHLKGYKKVKVRFLIIWTKEEYEKYFADYLSEVE